MVKSLIAVSVKNTILSLFQKKKKKQGLTSVKMISLNFETKWVQSCVTKSVRYS